MFKYDSVHGRFKGTVEAKDGKLIVNDQVFRTRRSYATIRELEDELALIAYPIVFGFEYPPWG